MTWSTGRKILNLRRDLGIKQQELAEMAGELRRRCRESRGWRSTATRGPTFHGIARAPWVTADYLLDESVPYPPPAGEDAPKVERPWEVVEMRVTAEERAHIRAMKKPRWRLFGAPGRLWLVGSGIDR